MKAHRTLQALKLVGLWGGGTVLLALIIFYIAGFFDEKIAPGPGAETTLPPARGQPSPVVVVEEPVLERYPGSVAAVREAAISSRLIARVREILVRPGQRVAKDEALVVLDSRDLEARFARTQEELVGAEAVLKERQANYDRTKSAAADGAVSRKQLDVAEAAYESAKSFMESTQKRLEEARVSLSFATIGAPFDAVVIDRWVEPGDLATPGRPLLKLYDPSEMRLEAWVREAMAIRLERGDALIVQLDTLGERLDGKVEEIVPQAEAGSRSFLVKVALPKRENLYPGMFGRLLLPAGSVERILVPAKAVSTVGQLSFVVLADERNTRRLVVPGERTTDGRLEILSGIHAGESVIVPE